MRLSTKRAIDRWLGTPLCFGLNLLACVLALLLRRDHTIRPNPRSIVVSKYLGIGSVVNAGPLLQALKRANAESTIVFLGTAGTARVVQRMVDLDELLIIDDRGAYSLLRSSLVVLLRLWRLRPELFIDLEAYSKFSSLIATLSCARNRLGLFLDTTLFRQRLYTHFVYLNRFQRITDVYQAVARALGMAACVGELQRLRVYESDRREADAFLATEGMADEPRPLVIVNPNAGELCLERRWPMASFVGLVEEMTKASRLWLILVGSAEEAEYTRGLYLELSPAARRSVRVAAGKLSLGGFLALLTRADLVISNDSGPFHLAQAMGVKTVSLWGPGTPLSYGPSRGDHVVVRTNIYCSPCLYLTDRPPCRGDNLCMKAIPVSGVLGAVERLQRRGEPGGSPIEIVIDLNHANFGDAVYRPGVIAIRSGYSPAASKGLMAIENEPVKRQPWGTGDAPRAGRDGQRL